MGQMTRPHQKEYCLVKASARLHKKQKRNFFDHERWRT